jgi:MFS family permease
MQPTSTCNNFACRLTVAGSVDKCPKCGTRMRTPSTVRKLGWFLLALGTFLVVMMGIVTFNMAGPMANPGTEMGGSTFTGDESQGHMILALFAGVIVFGLGTMASGIYQIRTGQRSKWIVIGTLVMAAGLFLLAYLTTRSLK